MGKFKEFYENINKEDLKKFTKTNSFIVVMLLAFFPVGIILMWKSKNFRKNVKVISSIVGSFWFLLFLVYSFSSTSYIEKYNELEEDYSELKYEKEMLETVNDRLDKTEDEYIEYKEKMTPYESLSEADATKRQNDNKLAQKVNDEINNLPEVSNMGISDKEKFKQVMESYNKLNDEQKQLVDSSIFSDYENKIKELEAEELKAKEEAKKEEEANKKRAEEEARGYDTGITYDQLARTPDDFIGKKVKFYGKVIQVMEGDDSTQIRMAVNDNYDTVVYAEYDSKTVTSRILEDDYITISGLSMGLLSYNSTMGGKITIPSVLVSKIDQ